MKVIRAFRRKGFFMIVVYDGFFYRYYFEVWFGVVLGM